MVNVLEHVVDWLFRPSDLPNIGHVTNALLVTWPLDSNSYEGDPDYTYTGQITRPAMTVLAGLDDTTVPNYKLYSLSIPTVSADDNGNVTFDDDIHLTSPEPGLGWWLPGTLQPDNPINPGSAPISATVGEAGQVVILDFCAVFPLHNLLGGANVPCRLTLTTSSLYIVPPTKGQPVNR